MKLANSKDPKSRPSVVMMVYGEGGVGKTTFAATAPKPLLVDCENGAKYLGLRGISVDVAQLEKFSEVKEVAELLKSGKYETVVIDPIGELMDKLKRYMLALNDSKLSQKDGAPTMAGWGWLKKTMRDYIKTLRDGGLNVLLIAHLTEEHDDQRIIKRPKIETKLADDLVNMVDVVAYMTVIQEEGQNKRVLIVDPGNDKYTAKDRTGQLGKVIEPDFKKIIAACNGTEKFSWSAPSATLNAPVETAPVEKPKAEMPVAKQLQALGESVNAIAPSETVLTPPVKEGGDNPCSDCPKGISDEVMKYSCRLFKVPLCRECQSNRKTKNA